MAKKIYVGNMSYETNEGSLRDLFAEHGEVISINLITDRYTGQSKGFGFIEMATDEEAKAAIAALNGTELDSRRLKVNEAYDKPRRGDRGGGYDSNRR